MLKISTDILASERSSLPSIHGSLRLLATLRTLASDGDSNEDLQESWVDAEELLTSTLIGLLVRLSGKSSVKSSTNHI